MGKNKKTTKYIFVLGGVMSGLGKGIAASSIGYLLKWRGRWGDQKVIFCRDQPFSIALCVNKQIQLQILNLLSFAINVCCETNQSGRNLII